jgi:23S rRNA (guanosine2251-2'-O)-methyltransferase
MKYVILDNVRSSHNVGAIFRTCDGAGVAKIFLLGYTPAPVDRFGRPVAEIVKTSLGASAMIPWEQVTDGPALLAQLRSEGVSIVAVEQSPHAISLYDFNPSGDVAYIFGNEIDGVAPDLMALSDHVIEIPMLGQKESLNVGVTVGIVLFKNAP